MKIETKLYDKEGVLMDQTSVEYKCSDLSGDCSEPIIFFNVKTIVISIGVLLLLVLLILFKKYLHKKDFIVSLLMLLILGVVLMPKVGEAKGVNPQWSTSSPAVLWFNSDGDEYMHPLENLDITVKYFATVKNITTNQNLNENDLVNSGDSLKFIFKKHTWEDIVWFATGGTVASPYGDWVENAEGTMPSFLGKGPSPTEYDAKYLLVDDGYRAVWGQFSVDPPVKNLINTNNLTCESMVPSTEGDYVNCIVNTITATTTINPTFEFGETYGKMYAYCYHYGYETRCANGAAILDYVVGNVFIQTVDKTTIPFSFIIQPAAACTGNLPPNQPIITGTTTASVSETVNFTFTATDQTSPADQIKYSYSIDGSAPIFTSYIPSGTSFIFTKTGGWTTAGNHTIIVTASDSCGESISTTHTITVSDTIPTLGTPTLTVAENCGYVDLSVQSVVNATHYSFTRNGIEIQYGTGLTFKDTNASTTGKDIYAVIAINDNGTPTDISDDILKQSTEKSAGSVCLSCPPGHSENQITGPQIPGGNCQQWNCDASYNWQPTNVFCLPTPPGPGTDPTATFSFDPSVVGTPAEFCGLNLTATNVTSCTLSTPGGTPIVISGTSGSISKLSDMIISVGRYTLSCTGTAIGATPQTFGTKTCLLNPDVRER